MVGPKFRILQVKIQLLNIKRSVTAKRRNGDEGVGREGLELIFQVFEAHHSKRHAHIGID